MLSVTATDLPRIIACNGSRLMEGFTSSIKTDDTVRDEGNAAHWLAEQVQKGLHTLDELIDRKAPNGVFITGEMADNLSDYIKAMGRSGFVELSTEFKGQNWIVKARADHIRYENNLLEVNDLKYGWSTVEPKGNWTLIAHAIGFCIANQIQPEKIRLTIYQPRPYHIDGFNRSWELSYSELVQYYNYINEVLSNPKDELHTGSHCKNCPALATCPAARKAELNGIDESEKVFEAEIKNDILSFRLDQLSRAIKVLEQNYKAYSEIALHRLKNGEIVNNYGIDTQLSNRGWKENVTAGFLQVLTGKDLTKKQLITPSQAEREGVSEELVASMTERFSKGIKLSRINTDKKAKKLFNKN